MFRCLDGRMLEIGDRVEVVILHDLSEVAHYDGEHGFVRDCYLDRDGVPTVSVRLDGLARTVTLHPYELMHEEEPRGLDLE